MLFFYVNNGVTKIYEEDENGKEESKSSKETRFCG